MSTKGLDRIARNEATVRAHLAGLGIDSLADIAEIPFESIEEVQTAHDNKKIEIGAEYNPEKLDSFGFDNEIMFHRFLTIIPLLIIVVDAVLGFTSKSTYFWGILLATIGFFGTGPRNNNAGFLGGIGLMAMIGFALAGNWPWVISISSLVVSVVAISVAKSMYVEYIKDKALRSEILFCHMFLTRTIILRHAATQQYIIPPKG
jgi:hypothetical protein